MLVKRIAMICVHTSPLAPLGGKKTGGMNVYVRELAAELGKQGVAVDIFTRRISEDEDEIDYAIADNVRVISVLAGPVHVLDPMDVYPYLQQFAAGVIAFATKHAVNYDFVYSHYWLSGWVANKLKEVWGTPFAHMFHTLGHMKNRIAPGNLPFMPDIRVAMETQIVHWADQIIAATPAERAQLLWLYRTKRRKIRIIPPGVNIDRFQPLPQHKAKQAIGITDDSHLLLFVGRIEPLKAVDTIIEAIDCIRQQNAALLNDVHFAIIGGDLESNDNDELIRLQNLVQELQLEKTVHFLGAKDQRKLPLYYAAATAVIMPSDYESFGMVALEAMASGTPVIASEVGGLAFLVRDNETGFHVPVREPVSLAERIATLLTDPSAYTRMGQSASQLAQQYAWSHIANRLIQEFDEVVKIRAARC